MAVRTPRLTFPALLLFALAVLSAAGLCQVQRVYLMPMGNGLDQYLANHLTAHSVFQVVTDPHQADMILTDQIGQGFHAQLQELLTTFAQPPPAKQPDPKDKATKETVDKDPALRTEQEFVRPSTFHRSRGNVFLVNRKTGEVVWSTFLPAKDTRPVELDRTSARIVDRIRKDRNPPSK